MTGPIESPRHPELDFTAIIPAKRLSTAKSRLHFDPARRRHLALSFAADVFATASAARHVAVAVAVTSDRDIATLCADHGVVMVQEQGVGRPTLLTAIELGREWTRRHRPASPVVVLPTDLPALTPEALDIVLEDAICHQQAFVPDLDGTGTTLLTARSPEHLQARFGPGSAARHMRCGAYQLRPDTPSVRLDVDSWDDLRAALTLGAGPSTVAAYRRLIFSSETA